MHRQSLGSPASKLHTHGDGIITHDINNNFISDKLSSSLSIDEQHKSQKPHQQRHILASSSTRLVHLIPLLTFLCFLILYLSSHDPSRKDLAQFTGFATLSSKNNVLDSIEVEDNLQGLLEIRSMRNLQQEEEQHHRFHRKFGQ